MSITVILDELDEVIEDLDALNHVPQERRDSIRTLIEDAQDALDKLSGEFGDENIDPDADLDDEVFGDDE